MCKLYNMFYEALLHKLKKKKKSNKRLYIYTYIHIPQLYFEIF